uniref:Glu_synthase domain-containing protein n=1 Tax=Panagrellus redivivus TaxID=6233 RepID=A0A7E4UPJ0_PANRE
MFSTAYHKKQPGLQVQMAFKPRTSSPDGLQAPDFESRWPSSPGLRVQMAFKPRTLHFSKPRTSKFLQAPDFEVRGSNKLRSVGLEGQLDSKSEETSKPISCEYKYARDGRARYKDFVERDYNMRPVGKDTLTACLAQQHNMPVTMIPIVIGACGEALRSQDGTPTSLVTNGARVCQILIIFQ